jgi:hypothetical protein
MAEQTLLSAAAIPYAVVHLRLRQSDEMREFSIRLLQNNPHLAAKSGARVLAMLAPLPAETALFGVNADRLPAI